LNIGNLAAHHAHRSGRRGQIRTASRGDFGRLSFPGDDFKRQREQGIPGQNRQGFAKLLVTGRAAAAEIIIVHRGQIIVDQRVGMHHFQGATRGNGKFRLSAAGFAGQHRQYWAKAFSPGQQAVRHRLAEISGAITV
jgi:hypothetical protein